MITFFITNSILLHNGKSGEGGKSKNNGDKIFAYKLKNFQNMVAGRESENHLNNSGSTGTVFNIEFLQGNVSNIHAEIKTGHINDLQTNLPPPFHNFF